MLQSRENVGALRALAVLGWSVSIASPPSICSPSQSLFLKT